MIDTAGVGSALTQALVLNERHPEPSFTFATLLISSGTCSIQAMT
jgi:hypothetical protein